MVNTEFYALRDTFDHEWDNRGEPRDIYEKPPAKGWLKESVAQWFDNHLHVWRRRKGTTLTIELGAWLGKTMRSVMAESDFNTWVAIDTWRGSPNHQAEPRYADLLPHLYEAFLHINIVHRHKCTPIRCDSLHGLRLCKEFRLKPDCIYIDTEHTAERVYKEVELAMALFPDALILGDDAQREDVCEGARKAVKETEYTTKRRVDFDTCEGAFIIA